MASVLVQVCSKVPGANGDDLPEVLVDLVRAVTTAAFVVFAGGRQVCRLDEEIALRPGEPVVFLRLTPLAGG